MDEALWVLGRGTGIASLVIFTVTVVLGILTRSGRPALGLPRFAVTLVHRNASLVGLVLIVIHVVSLLFDPYAELRLVDTLVPFLGEYRPFWLGLGTLGLDLLLALVVTALLRRRIGPRVFRAVHWLAYAMWPIALAHSLGTGTDAASGWFIALAVVCSAGVLAALAWRFSTGLVEFHDRRIGERS